VQPPDTRYAVRPDGVNVAYQAWGSGPVDLLYAPGFISHLDAQWADPGFARFFARLGSFARVITYDKPGTGCSDPIPYVPTIEERAEDIRLVLDAAGSERAVLLGFSEGGPACALVAASTPGRVISLILFGTLAATPSNGAYPELRERWEADLRRIYDVVEHWGEGRVTDLFAPSAGRRVQRRLLAAFERVAASPAMARALVQAVERINVLDVLPSVRVPTLVLHRTGDFVPIELGRDVADRIPGARFVELPGTDHLFFFGDYEGVAEEIERFVTGGRPVQAPDRVLATVLFTDVVDSTRRAAELGDAAWRALLERHNATVHDEVRRSGGRVVKLVGDGALSSFDGPARGVRCALALRDALAPAGLPIRAGVHTGECERIGDDIGGVAVHIGARVSAHAAAGEVLVSSTVADLVIGSGLRFEDRGVHELKGVPGTWQLLAVTEEGGREPFPSNEPRLLRRSDRAIARFATRFPRLAQTGTRIAAGR
jgi:class 3 adenylate cyclase/alpha-beta hydrolase superfamily lysophospholipase